jgi:hypothetical protein
MCKVMPVIPVNKVVDPKRIIRKRRAKEEERHKGLLTPPKSCPHFWANLRAKVMYALF